MGAGESAGAHPRRLWQGLRGRPELLWVAAIVALGGVVRFATLGAQSFDSGETITAARILHSSYGETFTAVASIERSGPLYYTLAWVWAHAFGTGEVALRSLSAIFGTATIALVFAAAREAFSTRAALIAAALVAASPDLIWYSQEARSYALFIMLAAAALYFFARALRRPGRGAIIGWAATSALALATHYFAIFLIAPEAVWLIATARVVDRRRFEIAAAAVAAAGLALLPLAIHQEGGGRANGFTAVPVLERGVSTLVKFVAGEGPSTSGQWTAVPLVSRLVGIAALCICAAAVVALYRRRRRDRGDPATALGAIVVASFGVPLILALGGFDFVEPRNLIGSLVPALVLVAAGIDRALRTAPAGAGRTAARVAPAAALGLSAAMVIATAVAPVLQRDDWRGLSVLLDRTGRIGVILTQPPSAGKPLRYYFGHPLMALNQDGFPCGVRARTIVTLSRNEPEPLPDSPFHLAAVTETAQHWRVATYRARAPRRLDPAELRILDLLKGDEAPRVDTATPIRPAGERGSLASRASVRGRVAASPTAQSCSGEPLTLRLQRS
jgi:hypothetical protein